MALESSANRVHGQWEPRATHPALPAPCPSKALPPYLVLPRPPSWAMATTAASLAGVGPTPRQPPRGSS